MIALLQCTLVEMLLQRSDSKTVIISVCRDMLNPREPADLATIATVFDKLNSVYLACLQREIDMLVCSTPTLATLHNRQLNRFPVLWSPVLLP